MSEDEKTVQAAARCRPNRSVEKATMSERDACCEPMRQAHRGGTDAEGWGAMFHKGRLTGGVDEVNFCPWCGVDLR